MRSVNYLDDMSLFTGMFARNISRTDISEATEMRRSIEIRGRKLVGCLKNNPDASFKRNNETRKIRIARN